MIYIEALFISLKLGNVNDLLFVSFFMTEELGLWTRITLKSTCGWARLPLTQGLGKPWLGSHEGSPSRES